MCNYMSGWIHATTGKVLCRTLVHHETDAAILGLKPDEARPFEWLGDSPDSLHVRLVPGEDHDANWYRACVLSQANSRTAFLASVFDDIAWQAWLATAGGTLDLSGLTSLPAGVKLTAGGYLDLGGKTLITNARGGRIVDLRTKGKE